METGERESWPAPPNEAPTNYCAPDEYCTKCGAALVVEPVWRERSFYSPLTGRPVESWFRYVRCPNWSWRDRLLSFLSLSRKHVRKKQEWISWALGPDGDIVHDGKWSDYWAVDI